MGVSNGVSDAHGSLPFLYFQAFLKPAAFKSGCRLGENLRESLRIKDSCFLCFVEEACVLQKMPASGTFGPVGPFRQITAHFFEQKDVQINRFGHIEHFRKKLPMISA